jgi:hypothetical protein
VAGNETVFDLAELLTVVRIELTNTTRELAQARERISELEHRLEHQKQDVSSPPEE